MRKKILGLLAEKGSFIQPDALNYLLEQEHPLAVLKHLMVRRKELPLVLTLDELRNFNEKRESFPPRAKETPQPLLTTAQGAGFKVREFAIKCNASLPGLRNYFLDRYEKLKKLLRRRGELVGVMPMDRVREGSAKVIGMVREVRNTKKGHKLVELEDPSGELLALIPKNSNLISLPLVKDEVVGMVGRQRRELFLVENISQPEVEATKSPKKSSIPLEVAFTSDIHLGSVTFLREAFEEFLEWLKKSQIECLVVAGDLVDGVGVYPGQKKELEITNVMRQYEKLADYFSHIPKHIKVIVFPGNHDLVRQAEPQPPLPQEIQELFTNNIEFLPNPCRFSLNGVEVLGYHGRSADDLIPNIPGLGYNTPIELMKHVLKRRHLAPIYGGKTLIAPTEKDVLVIDEVPDILVTGHIHACGYGDYKNIRLINASAWQSQTSYQRTLGIKPDPGKVLITNLQTMQTRVKSFV